MKKLLIIFIVVLLLVSLVLLFSELIIFPKNCEKCGDDPYEKAGLEKYDHKIFADENGSGNLSERIKDE